MKLRNILCMAMMLFCAPGAVAYDLVIGQTAKETGASEIQLVAFEEGKQFGDLLTWDVVKDYPRTTARTASTGGHISWSLYRVKETPEGTEHEYYEQRYTPDAKRFEFPGDIPENGFKVSGGYLAYHRTNGGVLYLVTGAIIKDIASLQTPVITSAEDAVMEAAYAADRSKEIEIDFLQYNVEGAQEALVAKAELWLHPVRNGEGSAEFGFAWHVPVLTSTGATLPAILDAESSELLHIEKAPSWDSNCGPDTYSPTLSVTGVPQRPVIGNFSLPGTPSMAGGWACGEAHVPATGTRPDIQILKGADSSLCHSNSSYQYDPALGICPGGSGVTYYDNIENYNPLWGGSYSCQPGRATADAVRHALTTFDVFWNYFGYQGMQGSGTPFRIVVDARCDEGPSYRPFGDYTAPANSIRFCGLTSDLPSTSTSEGCAAYDNLVMHCVALDIVAHEIGHGVIYHTTGLAYGSDLEQELHEGFADLIGHAVEQLQPNPPYEPADWTGGEDTGTIARRVDIDTGALRFFYSDTAHDGSPHARGTPLPVAFRLLAEGGVNPACYGGYNQPNSDACAINVGGLGDAGAAQVYFKLLDVYIQPFSDWQSFPGLIVAAAGAVSPTEALDRPIIAQAAVANWCVPYHNYKYRSWQSMAAIELPGNINFRFCSYPD